MDRNLDSYAGIYTYKHRISKVRPYFRLVVEDLKRPSSIPSSDIFQFLINDIIYYKVCMTLFSVLYDTNNFGCINHLTCRGRHNITISEIRYMIWCVLNISLSIKCSSLESNILIKSLDVQTRCGFSSIYNFFLLIYVYYIYIM